MLCVPLLFVELRAERAVEFGLRRQRGQLCLLVIRVVVCTESFATDLINLATQRRGYGTEVGLCVFFEFGSLAVVTAPLLPSLANGTISAPVNDETRVSSLIFLFSAIVFVS